MFLIGWFGFGESVGAPQLVAACMVLAGIVITSVRRI